MHLSHLLHDQAAEASKHASTQNTQIHLCLTLECNLKTNLKKLIYKKNPKFKKMQLNNLLVKFKNRDLISPNCYFKLKKNRGLSSYKKS